MREISKPAQSTDGAARVLGYLNFSSGAFDPVAWRALSDLFASVEPAIAGVIVERTDTAVRVAAILRERLAILEANEPAFRDARQARAVLEILFDRLLPAYRAYHCDLLEHQPPGGIERPFFVMAAAQAVLATGGPFEIDAAETDAIVAQSIASVNDYVGWRPVAVLENGRLSDPYPHERVRPIGLFVAGVGVAHGRPFGLVSGAIEILAAAPAALLQQADFDLSMLEELAIDPRAFDFLHPAASRPNYLFGLWDPSRIDAKGCYRRMVVQQATLDGILSWCDPLPEASIATGLSHDPHRQSQLRRESAAVLAGVMLMASGLSGHGPAAHQAGLPLSELLPRIAGYRDEFYRWLMTQLPQDHRERLEEETGRLRQPFGGVRRHINSLLAGRRAKQVESVALAAVLSRLGRADAAERMAGMVPAASARMLARITSQVVAAGQSLRQGNAAVASDHLDVATDLLFRAVGCGAAVDPWNILGLSGQFPLHEPGGESLPDPRVDDLVSITGSILDGYAAVWRKTRLDGPTDAASRAAAALERLAVWWDRHATTAVSGVEHLSGREVLDSAREVIGALEERRGLAATSPSPGFWRKQVASFSSPRSHSQAADELLDEGDLDGAMGLLVHWASLLDEEAIDRSGPEWLGAASRWMTQAAADRTEEGRSRVRRFLELVEANTSAVADCIERAKTQSGSDDVRHRGAGNGDDDDLSDDQADDDHPGGAESVAAAYESMVWRDSADDGVDGGMIDVDSPGGSPAGDIFEIEQAADFLAGVCRLLRHAVTVLCAIDVADHTIPSRAEIDSVIGWRHTLRRLRRTMVHVAGVIAAPDASPPPGMPPSEFDRLRWQRDSAAERLIEAAVQATETLWILSARLFVGRVPPPRQTESAMTGSPSSVTPENPPAIGRLFAAILSGDAAAARSALEIVQGRLVGKAVLYVPLSRGGRPDSIVRARSRERLLERLAACLPRLGLVAETSTIVHLAKSLENKRPRGAASVSEFDRVFTAATTSLVERIVESACATEGGHVPEKDLVTQRILDGLSLLVPKLLDTWMTHARQLRLSVLERVREPKAFAAVQEFIERYGAGLFTQHLLAPSSLRGILRGGVKHFLEHLVDRSMGEPSDELSEAPAREPTRLIEDLATGELPLKQAASRLRLVLESIAENHAEYRDWNSTTTQSDRGECLYMLLDLLRIKAEYDRIAWTLRPVSMAHRVLARRGTVEAAEAWRARMRDETRETASHLVEKLGKSESLWGVRLASIADRVGRPFTAPLEQDELEALVAPAVAELAAGNSTVAGQQLEERAAACLGLASGSGVEVPDWIEHLGQAVDRAMEQPEDGLSHKPQTGKLPDAVPWIIMPWELLHSVLEK